jgi:hypothetical protein
VSLHYNTFHHRLWSNTTPMHVTGSTSALP